jgi:hypothetical protein
MAVQAVHSVEECMGRLWESFPPARFVAGLISADHERGFVIGNIAVVAFGVWCFFWPVRRQWTSSALLLWFWVVVEVINGIAHPVWSLKNAAYTPGVATAPVLLVLAILLAIQLRRQSHESRPPA